LLKADYCIVSKFDLGNYGSNIFERFVREVFVHEENKRNGNEGNFTDANARVRLSFSCCEMRHQGGCNGCICSSDKEETRNITTIFFATRNKI
jgi:hypothetical protein